MQTPACAPDSSRKTARPGFRTWCCPTARTAANTGTAASSAYRLALVQKSYRSGLPRSFHRRHIAVTPPECHAYLAPRFPAEPASRRPRGRRDPGGEHEHRDDSRAEGRGQPEVVTAGGGSRQGEPHQIWPRGRSEEHTSELQSLRPL